jgi:glucose/arabinose dehydrogenase
MPRPRFLILAGPALVALLALAGCGDSKTDQKSGAKSGTPEADEKGPHGGQVFELKAKEGKHVHVELFEDGTDKKLVAVLLGEDEKTEVQSSADEATIETIRPEKNEFKLKAEAKDGKASHYSTTEEAALKALKAKGAKIKFHVEMDGKTYTAEADHILH